MMAVEERTVREGYKMTELGEIPVEWEVKSLSNVLIESREKIQPQEEDVTKRLSVKLNIKGVLPRISRDNDQLGTTIYFKRKKGQFIYGKQNLHKGAFGIIPDELDGYQSTQDIPSFDINKSIDSGWLLYYFSQDFFYKGLETLAKGTGSKRIHSKDLLNVKVLVPTKKEQQKITEILSTVDEQIENTEKLIEKTKELKKGLMQQLLTKGIGHSEFKMTELGEIPVGWDVTLLDNVAERKSGHTPNKKIESYWNGSTPWISLKDLSRLDKRYISETTDYTTIEGINNSSAVLLPTGTLVISRDATVGKVGITKKEMATSQHFINYICNKQLNNYFLYYYLSFKKHVFERIATGSTIKTIGLGFFKELKIVLPPILEQQKIAKVLFTVDEQIEEHEAEIRRYTELKKGLMQQLLTGKIRVQI